MDAVARLSPDPLMSSAFDGFSEYIQSSPPGKSNAEVEMVALDCVHPSKSPINIYVRSHRTSFDDVIDALTLGGVNLTQDFRNVILSLKQLRQAVLAVIPRVPRLSHS